MSKPKHARGIADNEAQAVLHNLRVSPRKLNLVAGLIRNKPAHRAGRAQGARERHRERGE